MGVTYVPGVGEEIGKALASLGGNISQVINPNQDMQREVKKLIATQPNAIKQIAAAYRKNSDALKGLLGDDMSSTILSSPPDFNEVYDDQMHKTLKDLLASPDGMSKLKSFMEAKVIGANGPVDAATQPAIADAASAELKKPGMSGKVARQQLTGQTGYQEEFDTARSGLLKKAMNYIRKDPNSDKGSAMETFSNYFSEDKMKAEMELWMAKDKINFDEAQKNIYTQNAIDSYQSSKVGSPATWYDVLTNRNGAGDVSRQLAADPSKAKTDEDNQLAAIGMWNNQQSSNVKAVAIAKNTATAMRYVDILNMDDKTIKPANESEKHSYLANLNNQLKLIENMGGPAYHAKLKGWYGSTFKERVVFMDENGDEVTSKDKMESALTSPAVSVDTTTPTKVTAPTNTSTNTQKDTTTYTDIENRAYARIQGFKGDKKAAIEEYEKRFGKDSADRMKKRLGMV